MSGRVARVPVAVDTQPVVRPTASNAAGPSFSRVLRDAMRSVERNGVAPGRTSPIPHDSLRALELQAEIYRHSERVELVSKLVDHTVSAVKTLLQTRF